MTELATAKTRATTDPLAAWALRRVRLDGRPFSFAGHQYLRAIYDDTAPHVVVSKAAQVGGTTWALLRSFHACLTGLSVIYFLPTKTDAIDFSKSRITPLLRENPFLAKLMTETDTVGLKKIGESFLHLRGMKSSVGMKSVPADLIVFDELDEAPPEAKALARERIAHSEYKRIIELSNPSLPDFGIDEVFQRSDQRHWTLRCPVCGAWVALEKEFPQKLGQEVRIILPRSDGTFYRACPKCEAELDLAAGEWVADFPGREIHGYRISQLFSSKVEPAEILQEYQTTRYRDRFYNLKIGVPWADLERRLDVVSVLALCGEKEMEAPPPEGMKVIRFMGVDTGKQLHVVILEQERERGDGHPELVYLGKCTEFGELDPLMQRFEVWRCVIDGMPETHATREFARRHRNRVYLNFFNENQRGVPKWDYKDLKVEVNRTEALDASRAAIRERRVALPRRSPLVEEFARHMAADAKQLDEDEETGARRYRYIRTGEDHFSLAFTYAWLAVTPVRRPRLIV